LEIHGSLVDVGGVIPIVGEEVLVAEHLSGFECESQAKPVLIGLHRNLDLCNEKATPIEYDAHWSTK
jgi:hypothetical protein